jgi:hypothetical protein
MAPTQAQWDEFGLALEQLRSGVLPTQPVYKGLPALTEADEPVLLPSPKPDTPEYEIWERQMAGDLPSPISIPPGESLEDMLSAEELLQLIQTEMNKRAYMPGRNALSLVRALTRLRAMMGDSLLLDYDGDEVQPLRLTSFS